MVADNVFIPTGYHLGFTAATGHLADNHDLYGFTVRNLDPNAPSIDSQLIHSLHDRYAISDSLSRLQYEVDYLSSKGTQCSTTSVGTPLGSGVGTELTAIKSGLNQVETIAKQLSTAISSIDSKISQGGGSQTPILRELIDVKTTLSSIVSKVSHLGSELNKKSDPSSCSDSSSNFYVIAFVVSLLIIGFLGYSLYQTQVEKNKKIW